MWLLFTAAVALAIVVIDWIPAIWPDYSRLPLITWLEATLGTGGAQLTALLIVLLVLYLLFWLLGNSLNFLSPESFRRFTDRLGEGRGTEPALWVLITVVPLLLLLSALFGGLDLYTSVLGVLVIITSAFILRPFSVVTRTLPALAQAPLKILRRDNPWAGVPPDPAPPDETSPVNTGWDSSQPR
ncbi:MAG: hypothetical protein ACJ78Q_12055 [Chloroflexia bacterium]